jgi:hypothetical protein
MPIDERQLYCAADLMRAARFFFARGEVESALKMLDGVKGICVQLNTCQATRPKSRCGSVAGSRST